MASPADRFANPHLSSISNRISQALFSRRTPKLEPSDNCALDALTLMLLEADAEKQALLDVYAIMLKVRTSEDEEVLARLEKLERDINTLQQTIEKL